MKKDMPIEELIVESFKIRDQVDRAIDRYKKAQKKAEALSKRADMIENVIFDKLSSRNVKDEAIRVGEFICFLNDVHVVIRKISDWKTV